ncbi:cobalt transporter CbiM [Candidatus Sulfidibacterium hydrothermale]|uniref:cobalt transporter CbiM n=1 Tax=Candidatus Sulfidibacterium hydrothermale TaxID=2875962 RepID=UPI001F0B536C|nr:cobalt transporter CbiM [Candidatus Sulfidibacterium hydrothermale]UBM63216.1 cobalt transporter CbiM [Candidatus Sulfidibacterium hydrothermale]
MHIPDGYVSPKVFIPFYLLFVPLFLKGIRKLRRELNRDVLPLLSSLTALSFIFMMFNIPIPGGTSGHALGTALIAIIFGPWAGFIAVSFVLLLQALLFGDGGITTYAINAISMGYVASFTGYYTFQFLKNRVSEKVSYFLSGWTSIVMASLVVAVVLGIEPSVASSAAGVPLYFPYGLKITLPAVVGSHMLFFGVVEGIFTLFGVSYFKRYVHEDAGFRPVAIKKSRQDTFLFFLIIVVVLLLVPLGLITENPAWGEWDLGFFHDKLGFIPAGIKHFSALYSAPLPDYTLPGMGKITSYYLSAVLALFVTTFVFYLFSRRRNVLFDKLFFINYLLVIFSVVISSDPYFILALLVVAFLLSGKDILRLTGRALAAILVFNLLSSVYFITTKNYSGLLVFNLRTFTLLYFTLLAGKKLNLFAVFSFSPFVSYTLTLAYSQIINYQITYEQMKQALASRTIQKIPLLHSYRILGYQINLFIKKSIENSKEIMQAVHSRSVL